MQADFQSIGKFPKLLLRQGKIDIERIECGQRNDLLTGIDILSHIYLANTKLPIKGACTSFFEIIELIWPTTAFNLLNFDSDASCSAFEMTWRAARSRLRCRSARANSKSASAVCNCASSDEASSLIKTSPFFASPPF